MSSYVKNLVAVLLVKFITSENFKKILVDIFVKVRAMLAAEEDWYDDAAQGVIGALLEAMSLADEVTAAEKAAAASASACSRPAARPPRPGSSNPSHARWGS